MLMLYTGQFLLVEDSRHHLKRKHPHLEARKTNFLEFTAKLHFSFQPHTSHWPRPSNGNRLSKPIHQAGSGCAAEADDPQDGGFH